MYCQFYINVMKEFYDLFHPNVDKMLKDKMDKTTIGGEKKSNRRLVGVHPTTNQNIYVLSNILYLYVLHIYWCRRIIRKY